VKKRFLFLFICYSAVCAVPWQGLYLVPEDYQGPQSSYYQEWGGNKPHATLFGFTEQPGFMEDVVAEIAATRESGWRLDCDRQQCVTKDYGRLKVLELNSRRIGEIVDTLSSLGFQKKKGTRPLHITLCKKSELPRFDVNRAIQALKNVRRWCLVVVTSVSSGGGKFRYHWGPCYKI